MKLGVESWGAIGGIWVPEAVELMTQHRNGNYTLPRRGGEVKLEERGEGRKTQPKWRTRDVVRMRRVRTSPSAIAVQCARWSGHRTLCFAS